MISLHDKGNINQIYMERKQQKKFKIIEKKYQTEQARQKQNPREFQERPNAVPFNKKMRGKF